MGLLWAMCFSHPSMTYPRILLSSSFFLLFFFFLGEFFFSSILPSGPLKTPKQVFFGDFHPPPPNLFLQIYIYFLSNWFLWCFGWVWTAFGGIVCAGVVFILGRADDVTVRENPAGFEQKSIKRRKKIKMRYFYDK